MSLPDRTMTERLAHPPKSGGAGAPAGSTGPTNPDSFRPSQTRRKATQVETHPSQTAAQQLGQTEALIRFVEALGAYEFNRWVADGMLCRRYISPDGNIDLTVRVP